LLVFLRVGYAALPYPRFEVVAGGCWLAGFFGSSNARSGWKTMASAAQAEVDVASPEIIEISFQWPVFQLSALGKRPRGKPSA